MILSSYLAIMYTQLNLIVKLVGLGIIGAYLLDQKLQIQVFCLGINSLLNRQVFFVAD